jgi:hypothetical protein
MPTSVEVRWFFEGPIPDEIEQRFCRDGLLYKAAPREDHYVMFPASLGLNVKLREGRLEIKSLVKALGARSFAADVSGNVQVWEKRSGGDAAFKEFERLRTGSPGLWIAVTKERTLRKFSPGGDSIKEVAAGKVFLSNGCNVELTKITVKGSDSWSLAFEAYGDPARVEELLMRVAALVLSNKRHPRPFKTRASSADVFSPANSHSYPEWLETLKKQLI